MTPISRSRFAALVLALRLAPLDGLRSEWFHLETDPFEQKNLAKEKPEELRRMRQGLVAELDKMESVYQVDEDGKELRPLVP